MDLAAQICAGSLEGVERLKLGAVSAPWLGCGGGGAWLDSPFRRIFEHSRGPPLPVARDDIDWIDASIRELRGVFRLNDLLPIVACALTTPNLRFTSSRTPCAMMMSGTMSRSAHGQTQNMCISVFRRCNPGMES